MNTIERLRQYINKASFSSNSDKLAALDCLDKIVRERQQLIEAIEDAAEEWAVYVEADIAPITLPKYIREVIAKVSNI